MLTNTIFHSVTEHWMRNEVSTMNSPLWPEKDIFWQQTDLARLVGEGWQAVHKQPLFNKQRQLSHSLPLLSRLGKNDFIQHGHEVADVDPGTCVDLCPQHVGQLSQSVRLAASLDQ